MKLNKKNITAVVCIMLTLMILSAACISPADPMVSGKNDGDLSAKMSAEPQNMQDNDTVQPDETQFSDAAPQCRVVLIEEVSSFTVDESKVGDKKTVNFAGKEYETTYKKTGHYYTGDYTVDFYQIIGSDDTMDSLENTIGLLPDGKIWSVITGSVIDIELAGEKSDEEVRAAVEEALKDEIDFSAFEHNKVSPPDETSGHVRYTLEWYNELSGIKTDGYLTVFLNPDGSVSFIMNKCAVGNSFAALPENIRIADYYHSIDEKVKETTSKQYGEDPISWQVNEDGAELTIVEGTPCILLRTDVKVKDGEDEYTESIKLAVLLEP